MKAFIRIVVIYLLCFIVVATGLNIFLFNRQKKTDNTRNVVMNRIAMEYQNEGKIDFSKFDNKYCPDNVNFFLINETNLKLLNQDGKTNKFIFPVQNDSAELNGFLVFEYSDKSFFRMMLIINSGLFLAFLFILIFAIFILEKVLKPFVEFQQYPERLSVGQITEKLPESKNKFFGKYIWAMNMLQDVLENERKKVRKLIKDKETLTSTFAHGIKTPVSNIKLYANAIQTGLYTQTVNEKDAEIAGKIEKNADDIQNLVLNILDTTTTSLFDYEPQITMFYMKEIADYISTEYDNKLTIKKIPYFIEQAENPLIKSDKTGVCKILFQLLDNAIKYGDGTGIKIKLERQGEKFYFSISNNGNTLGENEIPYMFNSFWRGSNASGVEGQGIGLFEAKQIAKKIGGDIFVNIQESQIEFLLMI